MSASFAVRATGLLLGLLAGIAAAGDDDAGAAPVVAMGAAKTWDFSVTLDGKPIGEHRFNLRATGDERLMQSTSQADFVVTLLGIPVFRYHHHAVEDWRGNCLRGLEASTEENGRTTRVRLRGDELAAHGGEGDASGCMMSFAYWNPAMLGQTRLINAQTGKTDAVRVVALGSAPIEVRGQQVTGRRWRISGPPEAIDVWYGPKGDWIGLDATVSGGRRLSYRLR